MEDILRDILERLIKVETKIDGYNTMRERVDKNCAKSEELEKRLNGIESNINWLWKTVAGALILAFIGANIIMK